MFGCPNDSDGFFAFCLARDELLAERTQGFSKVRSAPQAEHDE
ncbi:MAG: hypothetical protein ACOYJB_06465 [Christensenellaceae bacterium]